MIEITNKKKHPVQLIVRSKTAPRAFTTKNLPGLGKGNNVCHLPDERYTEYLDRLESMGLISTKRVPNKSLKGE